MAVFKDGGGREWRLRLARGHVVRLKADYGVDLDKAMLSYEGLAEEIFDDTGEKSTKALWFLCEQQAKERSMSEDDFAMMLDGDTMEGARQALCEELGNFSPRSPIGAVMKNQKSRRAFWMKVGTEMEAKLNSIADKLNQADSATNSPPSLESTPTQ